MKFLPGVMISRKIHRSLDSFFVIPHVHSSITFQPLSINSCLFILSRLTFSLNLSSQNPVRVLGDVAYLQLTCLCQKQPFTRMHTLYFASTISGRPGSLESWSLKRNPYLCNSFLIAISGFVFLLFMLAMLWLLLSFSIKFINILFA